MISTLLWRINVESSYYRHCFTRESYEEILLILLPLLKKIQNTLDKWNNLISSYLTACRIVSCHTTLYHIISSHHILFDFKLFDLILFQLFPILKLHLTPICINRSNIIVDQPSFLLHINLINYFQISDYNHKTNSYRKSNTF